MANYNPLKIEKKWQKKWEKAGVFKAKDFSKKSKFYLLVEFPYPSGTGLHTGHCRSYVGMDVIARKKRMQGFNVLFPMGWDAFGLPTENYAIKTGIHPAVATKKNTDNFRRQEKMLGLSFDWSREINTTDPKYYKWTQWIFLQLFKNGLAYKEKMPINWCPSCKIGLANEEVIDGGCERCGAGVIKKEKEQWILKITAYAERLIKDLDLVDFPGRVKTSQKEWIGKSEGVEIKFQITNFRLQIPVFTTRIDTIFGATYLVLAPENPAIAEIKSKISNYQEVRQYIERAKSKIERERVSIVKGKSGIELKGISAVNPANGKEIPVFVADYVLMNYGTGAVMAVPAHDQRDFDFAKKYNLPLVDAIKPVGSEIGGSGKAFEGEGVLINSGKFTGITSEDAREKITDWLNSKGLAQKKTHYKLRDWIFSRQRYWGEPIPMVRCEKCGWVPAPEKDLPVKLPDIKEYKPSEEGESPLAKVESWVKAKCPKCGGEARRETDVMPNWAGSNWYYLRYCDPKNNRQLANPKLLKYWMPVDWYNGGMEHTTLHLLYSRFIFKFLWDIGAVPKQIGPEPYKRRTSHGVILGEGGIKMSKSKGNVINPEEVAKQWGADTLRVYEMFMGPFEQMIAWDEKGLKGARRFLEKIWKLGNETFKTKGSAGLNNLLDKTVKKVSDDIDAMKFNTAVSSLMEFANAWQADEKGLGKKEFQEFLKILSPFVPHLSEELWGMAGFSGICFTQKWPKVSGKSVKEEKISLIIQINGKMRDIIEVEPGIGEEKAKKNAMSSEKIKKWVDGREIKKAIFVKDKLINFVI